MASRPAALFLFVPLGMWGGVHAGAWQDPETDPDPGMSFERIKQLVQLAERGKPTASSSPTRSPCSTG